VYPVKGNIMVEIIAAELNDAEEIIELQRLAYQSEAKLYNDWSLPALMQTIDSLKKEFERSVILKAIIEDNKIIGSVRAYIDDGICKIGRLIVDPEFQGQGIGSNLLEQIEGRYKNANSFELFTGNKSISNIRLYKKHGYVESHTKAMSETVTIVYLVKPVKNI
jgi:ribosomal protein S18 acetylase RimI-like enzyme